ncbi:hypothetical protein AALP_AA8G037900 [Arabis alpina]|uniref:NAC domain-containing protein n=1 Tax=Arabis alpina TaxID=50452 RepID=A0A087G4T8_ARAAL|nr:hypothetical protein AALP_AA8G037900 [Arabis alpina]
MGRDVMTGGGVLSALEEVPAKKSLPPGYRFHPTDEELVSYYLKKKVLGKTFFDVIAEVEIYKHKPSDLQEYSKLKTRDKEWYFFGAMEKKYDSGNRMNRKTKEGFWKATGKDREVHGGNQLIGMIKTLVFHKGSAPKGRRTNWVIHEYRLVENNESPQDEEEQGEYVLCKLFCKNDIGPPTGNRYAVFVEEEWEEWDEKSLIHIGNVRAMEDHVPIDVDDNVNNEIQQENNQSERKCLIDLNELPKDIEMDDYESHKRKYVAEAPLPPKQYKRRRSSRGNSNNSSQSTTTTVETTNVRSCASLAEKDTVTALLELNVPEQVGVHEDLMKAETMIKFLQGELNALREENMELRKNSSRNYNIGQSSCRRKRT